LFKSGKFDLIALAAKGEVRAGAAQTDPENNRVEQETT
jgi:hypothetical protein